MNTKTTILTLCLLLSSFLFAQNTQTVRGTVTDKTAKYPIIGAAVVLKQNDVIVKNTVTNVDGEFRLEEVPYGKYAIEVSFMGYQTFLNAEVNVQSGFQTVLNIELVESTFELDEVELVGVDHKGDAINEFATISSRTFSIEETERYAGSRGEPSRMAANYAGVVGNNDNSNDIVVRGNTPLGLLWRLDGVNIPNPNHFAAGGSTGGPVTMLNNQTLANSDFMTSAFPSEYGNTVAGVFDLKTRNGNNDQHQFSGELGFLGIKARAEGPFKKGGKSSFLAGYRYSTFAAFEAINFNIGTDAAPRYQDLNVKLNFPLKNNANLSVFAIGGTSGIDIEKSKSENPFEDVFGDPSSDEYFRTQMGVVGANYSKSISPKLFMQITGSVSAEQSENSIYALKWVVSDIENPSVSDKKLSIDYNFRQNKVGAAVDFKQKLNIRHNFKYGIFVDYYDFNFVDSTLLIPDSTYRTRVDYRGNGVMIQPYIDWSWAATEKLTVIAGVHGQYFDVSKSSSVEPRLGAKYQLDSKKWLEAGVGSHSQFLPTYVYFSRQFDNQGNYAMGNQNTDFLRSYHAVIGYNQMLSPYLRLKVEAYHQWLYNVPVTIAPSSYSILNEGGDLERFFPDSLNNGGDGRNYGVEFTLEKFFNNSYFVFVSGSLFSSTYEGSDGITYNTLFNSNFALNVLSAREFIWGARKQNKLTVGAKITWTGGRRYTPIDLDASEVAYDAVYDYSQRNEMQYKDYFRLDLSIKYRINAKNIGHEFGLDLVNVLNTKNFFKEEYNPVLKQGYTETQLGFLPIFYYRIDF